MTAHHPGVRRGAATPYLALAATLWACAFIAARRVGGDEGFDAEATLIGRVTLASASFAPLARSRWIPRLERGDVAPMLLLVATGHAGYLLFFHLGASGASAATASLIVNLAPVIGVAIAAAWLRDPVAPHQWVGVALAVAGTIPVSLADGGGFRLTTSVLWLFAAALAAGVFVAAQKPMVDRLGAIGVTAWGWWLSVPFSAAFLPRLVSQLPHASGRAIASLCFLGFGSSGIAYLVWAMGLRRSAASVAAAWLFSVPVIAVTGAWLVLGERPGAVTVAGGALALLGVWLAVSGATPTVRRARV